MYVCGQSVLYTAPGCETASSVPPATSLPVYEIHHKEGNNAKASLLHEARPDLCLLRASIT